MAAKTWSGSCQCGKVAFEVAGELAEATACNCSRCGRLGTLFSFVPAADFKLLRGEGATTEYQWGKKSIRHLFCATCGVQSFAHGSHPKLGAMVGVNLRCVDGIELDAVKVRHFDGRAL
jgi:hypothetical protein